MLSLKSLNTLAARVIPFEQAQVQIWHARVAVLRENPSCFAALTDAERIAAQRFLRDADRQRFIVSRGVLRCLLAGHARLPASTLRFETNAYGKPRLLPEQNPQQVQFNVAHSGNQVVVALAEKRALGVDIEDTQRELDYKQLAAYAFSPAEQRAWSALPEELQRPGFFACWTQKEAYIKWHGQGLSFPLAKFDVEVDPRRAPRLLAERLTGAAACVFLPVIAAPGYVAALATDAEPGLVQCQEFELE